MSDRACIRGCTIADVHFATCEHSGPTYTGAFPCRGCAPRECRDGSLICDQCFGRLRGLLNDAPDLLARLHSLADPAKATPTDQPQLRTRAVEPAAPVPADVLDAIAGVAEVVATVNPADLPTLSNDLDLITWLSAMVLDRHPDTDGIRAFWSVQDAVDRFGVERRDRNPMVWEPDTDGEIATFNVHEFGDPLVSQRDAAALTGVRVQKIIRWEKRGLLNRAVTIPGPRGSRKAMYRLSEVRAVWEREGANA